MTRKTVYIASPDTEQGLALARLLGGSNEFDLLGVLLPGESSRRTPLQCVDFGTALQDPVGQILPTGIRSTTYILGLGPADLGATTFRPDSLQTGDKVTMLERVEAAGVPVPRTWTAVEDVPESMGRVFYKEAHEVGGGRRGILDSDSDLGSGEDLIFQEFVDSQGTYGVAFLAQNGEVIERHAHFERFSSPRTGGSAVLIETHDDPRLVEHTERIVAATKYSGWGLAEFKWSPHRNEYVFMEVNSKLWASCEFTFRANPRFLEKIVGTEFQERARPRAMLFVHRLVTLRVPYVLAPLRRAVGSQPCVYPGLWRSMLLAHVPKRLKNHIVGRLRQRSVNV